MSVSLNLVFFHLLSARSWSSILFHPSHCFCHLMPLSLHILLLSTHLLLPPSFSFSHSLFSLFFSASSFTCLSFSLSSLYALLSHMPPPLLPFSHQHLSPHLTLLPFCLIPFIPSLFLLPPDLCIQQQAHGTGSLCVRQAVE